MEIEYCDICGMIIKRREEIKNPIEASPQAVDRFFWGITHTQKEEPKKPFVCNLDVCDVCERLFNLFCMKLVEIRRKDVKEIISDKELEALKNF